MISEFRLVETTGTSATYAWRTDRPADARLEYEPVLHYGPTPDMFATVAAGPELIYHNVMTNSLLSTEHRFVLANLRPRTGYYVRASSRSEGVDSASKTHAFSTRVVVPEIPPSGSKLKDFILARGEVLAEAQRAERARISNLAELSAYQAKVRKAFVEGIGGFPEKTPLNARVLKVIDRGDYVIENIVFESFPNFFVPGNLYRPKKQAGRLPGILGLSGHSYECKSGVQDAQLKAANLVLKGYVVLHIDPPGQNEMGWDGTATYDIHYNDGGNAHSLMEFNALLVGQSVTRFVLWDSIRAIDYLVSRPEVDPDRIGVHGSSGGGSQTMCVAALDPRVKVAVPTHIVADTFMTMKGPHSGYKAGCGISTLDEESHPLNLLDQGLSYTAVLSLIAPRTLVMVAATVDLQPLWATQVVADELKGIYDRVGASDRFCMPTVEGYHSIHSIRQFPYWAFNREFDKEKEGLRETTTDLLPPGSDSKTDKRQPTPLDVSQHSSMVRDFNSDTIHTQLARAARKLAQARPVWLAQQDGAASRAELKRHIRECLGLPESLSQPNVRRELAITNAAQVVQPFILEADPGVPVRAELYLSRAPGKKALIYLRDQIPTRTDLLRGADRISGLLNQGHPILAIAVRGITDDLPPGENRITFGLSTAHERRVHDSVAIGRPLLGQRVLDVLAGVELLEAEGYREIGVIGHGAGGLWALYAAALDERIKSVAVCQALASYQRVVESPCPTWIQGDRLDSIIVPGALRFFDLPDLACLMAPRRLWLVGLMDAAGQPLKPSEIRADYARAIARYQSMDAEGQVAIPSGDRGVEPGIFLNGATP